MGNCFGGKRAAAVQPVEGVIEEEPSSGVIRVQVRMTARQLNEMRARAGRSKGDSELGRMILQECAEGRLVPLVVAGHGNNLSVPQHSRAWVLGTINEE